jgi:hypothetical protein
VPRFVGQGDELAADLRQNPFDQPWSRVKADLQGVFEDQRQQRAEAWLQTIGPRYPAASR